MADINQVQLPDGSQYNITDTTSGYATQSYVQSAISGITKATIGLGNVDNTSDANKPVSTAQQTALDGKTDTSVIAYTETSTTATKRYEIGDQFILNGVLYTATAIIANGGTITVGTNCSASDTIIDQLSNIPADDVAFDNTGTDIVADKVGSAIKEVNAKTSGLTRMTKLWENPSPTASFAAQNITLASADYDMLLVETAYTSSIGYGGSNIFPKGVTCILTVSYTGAGQGTVIARRIITYNSATSLSISACQLAVGSTASDNNTACIPIAIYGIKII